MHHPQRRKVTTSMVGLKWYIYHVTNWYPAPENDPVHRPWLAGLYIEQAELDSDLSLGLMLVLHGSSDCSADADMVHLVLCVVFL